MKTRLIILFLFAISGLLSAGFAYGTSVQNDVSVKASTGGNSSGGTTNNGSGEASVFIETKVDGEVVHHIEETQQSEAGEPIEIEKQVEYNSDAVEIKSDVQASASTTTNKEKVEEEETPAQSLPLAGNEAGPPQSGEASLGGESKPLIARLVEWVQSIFSWFLA